MEYDQIVLVRVEAYGTLFWQCLTMRCNPVMFMRPKASFTQSFTALCKIKKALKKASCTCLYYRLVIYRSVIQCPQTAVVPYSTYLGLCCYTEAQRFFLTLLVLGDIKVVLHGGIIQRDMGCIWYCKIEPHGLLVTSEEQPFLISQRPVLASIRIVCVCKFSLLQKEENALVPAKPE